MNLLNGRICKTVFFRLSSRPDKRFFSESLPNALQSYWNTQGAKFELKAEFETGKASGLMPYLFSFSHQFSQQSETRILHCATSSILATTRLHHDVKEDNYLLTLDVDYPK